MQGPVKDMLMIAERDGNFTQDVPELVPFRGELVLQEIPGHCRETGLVLVDLLPDPPGLLIVPGADGEISLEILPLLIRHEKKSTVHTEPLSRGYGGERH